MKKILQASLALLLLSACFSRSTLMTRETFEGIDLGTSVADLRREAGSPYAVRSLKNGEEEYEYIERMNMGGCTLMENHYYLIISNGEVVSKRIKTETPPGYKLLYDADPNYPCQN